MLNYVPFSCLGIRIHACLLKAKKILEVGVQGSKLSIYTYLTYCITAYMITGNSRKSCLLKKLERNVTHLFHPRLKYNEAKI